MSLTGTWDAQALALVAQGDADALTRLYDRYASFAFRAAMRVTGEAALAEDAVQEAFLEIWRNAPTYDRQRAAPRVWICAIAHHRAVDLMRRRGSSMSLPGSETLVPKQLVLPDIWAEVAQRLSADELRAALLALSPRKREVIELAFFGGLTHREIARTTSTPLGTVKSRIRHGLVAMRSALAPGRPDTAVRARPAMLLQVALDARDLGALLKMIRRDVIWLAARGEEPRRVCTGREEVRERWRAFRKAGGNALPRVVLERDAIVVLDPQRHGGHGPAVFHVLRYQGAEIASIEDYPDQESAIAAVSQAPGPS